MFYFVTIFLLNKNISVCISFISLICRNCVSTENNAINMVHCKMPLRNVLCIVSLNIPVHVPPLGQSSRGNDPLHYSPCAAWRHNSRCEESHKKDAWFTICCSMRHVKIFLKLLSRKNVRFFDFYEDKWFWTSALCSC